MNESIGGTQIAGMTAEAIRRSGLKVGDDVREMAKQARARCNALLAEIKETLDSAAKRIQDVCDAIEKEAEDAAQVAVSQTDQLATKVNHYIEGCAAASVSIQQHCQTLMTLPELIPPTEGVHDIAAKAVEEALLSAKQLGAAPKLPNIGVER